MASIAYFIHGRGRGHATRSKPIVEKLRGLGHDVFVFAGGDALNALPDVALTALPTIRPGVAAMWKTMRSLPSYRDRLRECDAQLVITDGEGPSLFAAHSLRLPSIAIGHGLVFRHAQLPALPMLSRVYEVLNAGSSSVGATRKVAVHFLAAQARDDKTRIARADMSDLAPFVGACHETESEGVAEGLRLVSYFRDDNGDAVHRALLSAGAQVEHFGGRGAAVAGVVQRASERGSFLQALSQANAVVASAGSNLMSESIALQKPLLAIYKRRDHEQRMNAMMLEAANLGVGCALEDMSGDVAAAFLQRVRRGKFQRYALWKALPAVSDSVAQCVAELT